MRLLLIFAAIFSYVICTHATKEKKKSEKSSIILADGIVGILQQYLDEDKDITNVLDSLKLLSHVQSQKFVTLVSAILNGIGNLDSALQAIQKDFLKIMSEVDSDETSQVGVYSVPTYQIDFIISSLQNINNTANVIQTQFLQLANAGNSMTSSGLSGIALPSMNDATTNEIDNIDESLGAIGTIITALQNSEQRNSNTLIVMEPLTNLVMDAVSRIPNFYTLIKHIVKLILKNQPTASI